MKEPEFRLAKVSEVERVFEVFEQTICKIYPSCYPPEVVSFFLEIHNKESVKRQVAAGQMYVLIRKNIILGIGSFEENHITGLYVLPEYQNMGYGSIILEALENLIAQNYNTIILEASVPALPLYKKRGYEIVDYGTANLENEVCFRYEIMEKKLH